MEWSLSDWVPSGRARPPFFARAVHYGTARVQVSGIDLGNADSFLLVEVVKQTTAHNASNRDHHDGIDETVKYDLLHGYSLH